MRNPSQPKFKLASAAVCGAAAARAGLQAEPGRHGRTGRPGSDSDGTRAVPPVGRSLMSGPTMNDRHARRR